MLKAKKGRGGNVITKIRTVHARSNFVSQITDDTVLYLNENKKETDKWFQAQGQPVPMRGTKYGFMRSITLKDKNVNNNSSNESYSSDTLDTEYLKTVENGDISFSSDDLKYYSGSKGSENLYNTPENLKPESEREWATFNRSFANQTNDLKKGKKDNIIIYASDYAYFVTADGYMSGIIVDKILIDGNEETIKSELEEFKNGTYKSSKRINSVIQSIRNDRKRNYLGDALSSDNSEARRNADLDREKYGGNSGTSSSKSDIFEIDGDGIYSSDDLSAVQDKLLDRYEKGARKSEQNEAPRSKVGRAPSGKQLSGTARG